MLEHYGLVLPLAWGSKQYLVPALLKDELLPIESAADSCEFIFNFCESTDGPCLDGSQVGHGFLPHALFLRLLGLCVQMTQVKLTEHKSGC